MIYLLKYYKNYKRDLIIILIASIIQITGIFSIPLFTSNIINTGIINKDINFIITTGIKMLLVSLTIVLTNILSIWISSTFTSNISKNIRYHIFKKIQTLSLNDLDKIGKSSILTRIVNDVNLIGQTIILMLQLILFSSLMTIIGTIMSTKKDYMLSLIIIITLIIFLFFSYIIIKKTIPLFSKLQSKLDKISQAFLESITGIRVIRAFNKQKSEKERFKNIINDYGNIAIKINKIMSILVPLAILIIHFGVIVIIWVGGVRLGKEIIKIGDIVAIVDYFFIILYSLLMSVVTFLNIPKAKVSSKRIKEIFNLTPSIIDNPDNLNNINTKTLNSSNNLIEFKNVYFSYDSSSNYILKNINFTCNKGEIISIIGNTGAGKSTLLKLIPRFIDVTKGEILINNVNIKNMTQKALRNKISFTAQKAFLFSGTIENNIKLGNKNITKDKIIKATKIAQAYDFIMSLDDKYDYKISQDGTNLSGGQKQRISIARSLVNTPEIYLFDDSFSALDLKTEFKLRKDLKLEIKNSNSAAIIIAQKITSVIDSDKIIVLSDGEIVNIGTHDKLIKNCEEYINIAKSQHYLEDK